LVSDAFDKRNNSKDKEEPLKSSAPLHALGESEEGALIVLVPTPVMSTNGHKAIDISESLYQALTQPFDREPTLTELAAFLSSEPLLQIPLLPPRHDSVTRYFFEQGMGRFTGRFRLTQTEDFSMAHSLESLPTMQFQIGNGESTLHYFVDLFMRQFFEVIIASTTLKVRMDRNTTDSSRTTEEKKRPDFLCYINNFLLLRGEEKKDSSGYADAVHELSEKLKSWNTVIFGRLNYIFGYVLAGEIFRLFAIGPGGKIEEISNMLDLQKRSDRFDLFFLLVNLARVIKTILYRIPITSHPLYQPIRSSDGCTIEIRENVVVKRFSVSNMVYDKRFEFLKGLYVALSQNSVSCVPKVKDIRKTRDQTEFGRIIELTILTHGCKIMPKNLDELLIALKCVLSALDGVHTLKYAHQDIRWPNILYVSDSYWILIDFENACFGKNALYERDIRSVGQLINEWIDKNPTGISHAISSFRDQLVSKNPPSASDALKILEVMDFSKDLAV